MFLVVVFSKNALYAMSALAAGMILISGFFFLLNADFLGVVQIIVYTGAVMALYAFGMMFLDSTTDIKENNKDEKLVYGLTIVSGLLMIGMIVAPFMGEHLLLDAPLSNPDLFGGNNPQQVGVVLFTKYLVPFELAAIMLLVAMIAGIILVGKKMDDSITLHTDDKIEKEEFDVKEEK
jgi:NADH-quinone oxidoreductase subunit J